MTGIGQPAAADAPLAQPGMQTASGPQRLDIPPDLSAWAEQSGPAAVLAAARARCEAGQVGARLSLDVPLDEVERRAVSTLLGLQWRVSGRPATLGMLRTGLAERGVALVDLLTAVGGPLRNRKLELAQQQQAKSDADADAMCALTEAGVPPELARVAVARWLGPHTRRIEVARQVAIALSRLPVAPGTLLATLASELFSDPHDLDKDRLLGRACARILAAMHGELRDTRVGLAHLPIHQAAGPSAVGSASPSLDAESWRDAWERVGVVCDRVSSTVLVLNLPTLIPDDGAGTAARVAALRVASIGEPLWLTVRLLGSEFRLIAGSAEGVTIRVCENPAVVEAAAGQLGAACPPLVCTYGRPSLAARSLLAALSNAGARLLMSADRDEAGTSILDGLLAEFPGGQRWLPDAEGLFEEERLAVMLADLVSHAARTEAGTPDLG